eukprot:m.336245 g.336245  ORF g.336245 m.336245 type:complete len:398 (+) comp27782_c0_seq1:1310-2503(+)
MGATFSSNKASKLEQWLVEGIKLKQPEKARRVLRQNGVTTLTELMLLCEPERDELVAAMKRADIVLGDRSKIRRAGAHSISEYIKQLQADGQFSVSDRSSPASSRRGSSAQVRRKSSLNSLPEAPPARQTSKNLKGAPNWWKEHDVKIIKLAKAQVKSGPSNTAYEWQSFRTHGWDKYQQALWKRRQEMLDARRFTRDPVLKREWLALVLEIDRTLEGKSGGEDVPVNEDYVWYTQRSEPSYVKALLQRRTEMLRCDLTQNPALQGEWVLLMRELEHALAPASERSRLASAQDSGMSSSPPGTPSNSDGQSRLLDNIEAWRLDIETATAAERPQSVCSALTDNSGIGRAASLASIYSGNPSDYQSDVDEFFSDCEHDESTIWPATKVEIPHQMLAVA